MKSTREYIKSISKEITELLLLKNANYGDTANNPPQIFSKLSAQEAICARLDDKLSRIKKLSINHIGGINDKTDESSKDTIKDIIGYMILLLVQIQKREDKIVAGLIELKNKKKNDL